MSIMSNCYSSKVRANMKNGVLLDAKVYRHVSLEFFFLRQQMQSKLGRRGYHLEKIREVVRLEMVKDMDTPPLLPWLLSVPSKPTER